MSKVVSETGTIKGNVGTAAECVAAALSVPRGAQWLRLGQLPVWCKPQCPRLSPCPCRVCATTVQPTLK